MRIVEEIHKEVSKIIKPGDFAVDATVGNGKDCEFLLKLGAKVVGFDIQEEAIFKTRLYLEKSGLIDNITLHKIGHENMLEVIPKSWINNVSVVMFNLGYLPGGNKSIITQAESTVKALESACGLLKPGGHLSVVVYPDHAGGKDEAMAVEQWMRRICAEVKYFKKEQGPLGYWVRKLPIPILK